MHGPNRFLMRFFFLTLADFGWFFHIFHYFFSLSPVFSIIMILTTLKKLSSRELSWSNSLISTRIHNLLHMICDKNTKDQVRRNNFDVRLNITVSLLRYWHHYPFLPHVLRNFDWFSRSKGFHFPFCIDQATVFVLSIVPLFSWFRSLPDCTPSTDKSWHEWTPIGGNKRTKTKTFPKSVPSTVSLAPDLTVIVIVLRF